MGAKEFAILIKQIIIYYVLSMIYKVIYICQN